MEWDYVIIGSGFGGSVSALRLVSKGYKVLLLEQGRRLEASDFPRTNWNLKRWLWWPKAGFRGLFKMTFLRHVTVLSGVGVGGGSLVYANTLPRPKRPFFEAPGFGELADWERELEPHYATALRMLGAAKNPRLGRSDRELRALAERLGRSEDFSPTTVAVHFGEPGVTVPDPYFDGEGPERTGCISCGGCMLGCRFGAKNTLDKNYLYLAEKRGLTLESDSEVCWVAPRSGGGYVLTVRRGARAWFRKREQLFARRVIFAGGVMGSVPLLLALRESRAGLPKLSRRLGEFVRTNSEALIGVTDPDPTVDYSDGIAIGSIFQTDEHSHVEPVRYPKGSGFFRLLAAPHAGVGNGIVRLSRLVTGFVRNPVRLLRVYLVGDWAKQTLILLYMRSLEGALTMRLERSFRTLFRKRLGTASRGERPRASIREATELATNVADKLGTVPTSMLTETLLDVPTTAHILGGASMGKDPESGVIDHRHRVFGYEDLYVIDGSAISANPGVNPSLTIAALAERAMSFIPDASEAE